MEIFVNGEKKNIEGPCSIAQLIPQLGLPIPKSKTPQKVVGMAVAINEEIIPRSRHEEILVQANDRVEIIHPVGGG